MWLYLLIGFLGFLTYYLILSPFIYLLILKVKLGNKAILNFIPLLGDIYEITSSYKKYGDHYESIRRYFRENKAAKFLLMNVFNTPLIIVEDPEYIKQIHSDHERFKKLDFLNYNFRLMGQGLLFQSGQKWKNQRLLLGKPFDYDKLKARLPMMNRIVKEKLSTLQFNNVLELTRSIAGDVVIQTFFGQEVQGVKLNGREIQQEIVELFNDIVEIIFGKFIGFIKWMVLGEKQWTVFPTKAERGVSRRVEDLNQFAQNVIERRIKSIEEKGFIQNEDDCDFLDIHLQELMSKDNKTGITKQEIVSQFITLFFAGTDTTSSLAAMCLFYLTYHPDVYDALVAEVEKVVGDGDVLDQHLPKLQEMNSFIWEVLRVRNPASGPLVRVVKEDMMLKDLRLKKGWIVLPANFVQQHTDKYFDNNEAFDHKRFLSSNIIKNDNGFVNTPFSAGPRNCIGQHMAMMEIKIILCHILRKYKIQQVEEKFKGLQWKAKFLYMFEPIDCIKLVQK